MGGLQILSDNQDLVQSESDHQDTGIVKWRAAAGWQQGRSHVSTSVPCQDQVVIFTSPDGIVVGALADGAGSARYSHYGAELLVSRASQLVADRFEPLFRATNNLGALRTQLTQDLQQTLFDLAANGIDVTDDDRTRIGLPTRSEAKLLKCEPRELAATLLVVAVRDDRFITLHLGDGVIGMEQILKSGNRITKPLATPDNGEFVNETKFITSRDAADSMRIFRGRLRTTAREVTGFVLMSDGPEVSLYKRSTNTMANACSKLIQACRELPARIMQEQLSDTLRDVIAPRTHDDCSIVLLARKSKTAE